MFVVDKDLKILINNGTIKLKLNDKFLTSDELGDRIRPCSINLRLSNKFWVPQKRKTINLGNTFYIKKIQSLLWKEKYIRPNQYIILKPGDIVFARTEEYVYIPRNYSAILQTKSSFLRLGIEASMQRFANPGWEGFWPLQICNNGKFKVKIFPGCDIVQVAYIKLNSDVEHDYSTGVYQFDDGGPSKWWLDQSIQEICKNISGNYQFIFDNILNNVRDEYKLQVAIRLEKFIRKNSFPPENLENLFKQNEKKKKGFSDFCKAICSIPPFAGAVIDIFALFSQVISPKTFVLIFICCIFYLFFVYRINIYLTNRWYYTN